MKIFMSWSGDRSRAVAEALERFLPDVVDGVKIWFSEQDISPGSRWNQELSKELEDNSFGVICLTPENLDSRWVQFEAGALSKSIANSRVVPYRLELEPADVPPPLGQFQGLNADKRGTWSLISSLHEACEDSDDSDRVERRFEKFWPDFEQEIVAIPKPVERSSSHREDRELLEELLEMVRDLRTASSKEVAHRAEIETSDSELRTREIMREYLSTRRLYIKNIHLFDKIEREYIENNITILTDSINSKDFNNALATLKILQDAISGKL